MARGALMEEYTRIRRHRQAFYVAAHGAGEIGQEVHVRILIPVHVEWHPSREVRPNETRISCEGAARQPPRIPAVQYGARRLPETERALASCMRWLGTAGCGVANWVLSKHLGAPTHDRRKVCLVSPYKE